MVRTVAGEAGLTRAAADESITATLTVLAERVTPDETRDLLAQLPKALKTRISAAPQPTNYTPDEFLARVAELISGDDLANVGARVRAVFSVLGDAVNAGEMRDIVEQLGTGYSDLSGRPEPAEPEEASDTEAPEKAEVPSDIGTPAMAEVASDTAPPATVGAVSVTGASATVGAVSDTAASATAKAASVTEAAGGGVLAIVTRSAGAAREAACSVVGAASGLAGDALREIRTAVGRVPAAITRTLRHAGAIGARKTEVVADTVEDRADAIEDAAERAAARFDDRAHTG
jgi:uncharacterized protein (DUF2267 family)